MNILLLRVVLAPCVVLLVSIVARRIGPARGGRLLGAPATTAPFVLLVALGSGPRAAADAVHGSVAGQLAVAGFCLGYGRLAPRLRPGWTCLAALGCAAAGDLAGASIRNLGLTVLLDLAVLVVGLLTWPSAPGDANPPQTEAKRGYGEVLGRMALSGGTVFIAVSVAGAAGPFVGGVLSSLPILLVIMSVSIHRSTGGAAAAQFARGAVTTSIATAGFLLTLAVCLVPLGVPAAYGLAIAAFVLADRCGRLLTPSSASRSSSEPHRVRPTRHGRRPAVG
jgi:hypothetical protein